MKTYSKFSYYYDDIMQHIDYKKMFEFTKKYIKKDDKILDLACGTGSFLTLLKLHDYNVTGLDLSSNMINIAKEKAKLNRFDINYHVGDMTNFDLNEKFDVITCFFDSINMLDSIDLVNKLFDMVHKHLNDKGIFIFDIISFSKFKESHNMLFKDTFDHFNFKWKVKVIKPNIIKHIIKINDTKKDKEIYHQYYYDDNEIDMKNFNILSMTTDFNEDYDVNSDVIVFALQKNKGFA